MWNSGRAVSRQPASSVRTLDLPIPARRQWAVAALPDTMRDLAVKAVARFIRNRSVMARTSASQLGIVGWD